MSRKEEGTTFAPIEAQKNMDSSRIMTLKDLSVYLNVHTSTVHRALKYHGLPAFKIGRHWRFNVETIDDWRLKQQGAASRYDTNHAQVGTGVSACVLKDTPRSDCIATQTRPAVTE